MRTTASQAIERREADRERGEDADEALGAQAVRAGGRGLLVAGAAREQGAHAAIASCSIAETLRQ